jgi:uncharacterized protein YoxC
MDTWLKFFIALACISMIAQFGVLLGMYFQMKRLSEKVTQTTSDLQAKTEPILSRVQVLVDDIQPKLSSASADAAEVAQIARVQAERMDRLFAEGMDRLRLQLIRADQMISGTLEQIENTGAEMKRTLLGPVREVSALLKGVNAGIEFLRGSRRRSSERTRETQDEELFI